MVIFRKWLSLGYTRTLIFGALVVAMLLCSLPMTHADHGDHGHGHHHGEMATSFIDTAHLDEQNETDDRSTHQHIGLNEHNHGHVSVLFSGFDLNARAEQWRFVKAQQPRQNFLYPFERPPRVWRF